MYYWQCLWWPRATGGKHILFCRIPKGLHHVVCEEKQIDVCGLADQMILASAKRIARRAGGWASLSWECKQASVFGTNKFLHAFAFDIDGVLCKGKNVLPQAKEAMIKVWMFQLISDTKIPR